MNNQKGIAPIIVILVLVAIIGGGTLVWQNFSAQKEEVEISEGLVEDKTADWQIYKNTKGNYEIKIPKDWKIEEWKPSTPEEIELGKSPAPRTAQTFFKSPDYQEHWEGKALIYYSGAILDIMVTDDGPPPDQCSIPSDYLEKMVSEPFIRGVSEGDWKIRAHFGCGWRGYDFTIVCKEVNHLQNEEIFKQMLSTFRFLEQKKYIKVLSPNREESLTEGQDILITWESKGIEKVVIRLIAYNLEKKETPLDGREEYYIVSLDGVDTEKGVYNWSIPTEINFDSYPYYKIHIEDSAYFGRPGATRDFSDDYFSINQ